ncbi:MAG: response regulator transcription factor [Chloroflexi bacterium]|nr:response regulator transcription factor [Chloroflexota bacterium]
MRKVIIAQFKKEASSRIASILSQERFKTIIAETGRDILLNVQKEDDWDLIILDTTLPDMDGERICYSVRETTIVPILVLTDANQVDTEIRMLDSGADEFILKPVVGDVLLARVFALLRRFQRLDRSPRMGRFQFDTKVRMGNRQVKLTPSEFRLFTILATNPGRVLRARSLVREVQGYDVTSERAQNLIKVHVHNLRGKLGEGKGVPFRIVNVRGTGYMFDRRLYARARRITAIS